MLLSYIFVSLPILGRCQRSCSVIVPTFSWRFSMPSWSLSPLNLITGNIRGGIKTHSNSWNKNNNRLISEGAAGKEPPRHIATCMGLIRSKSLKSCYFLVFLWKDAICKLLIPFWNKSLTCLKLLHKKYMEQFIHFLL